MRKTKDNKDCIALSFLHFNDDQTELIIFGPRVEEAPPRDLDPLLSYFESTVFCFGVNVDSGFRLAQQTNLVVKSSINHLRLLSKIESVLSCNKFEQVTHAFISTRLNCLNALYIASAETYCLPGFSPTLS